MAPVDTQSIPRNFSEESDSDSETVMGDVFPNEIDIPDGCKLTLPQTYRIWGFTEYTPKQILIPQMLRSLRSKIIQATAHH